MQTGSLKKVNRKGGPTWLLRCRVKTNNGKIVERPRIVGLVKDWPTITKVRGHILNSGLLAAINSDQRPAPEALTFRTLALRTLATKYIPTLRAHTTCATAHFYIETFLLPKWGDCPAMELDQAALEDWLDSLRTEYEGPTLAKLKAFVSKIYALGIRDKLITDNPARGWKLEHVKSTYTAVTIAPVQTADILRHLQHPLHKMLVLLAAGTALRSSELCGLQWRDVDWSQGELAVNRKWAANKLGAPKTDASAAAVPLHPLLATVLQEWRQMTAYAKDTDWIFPSYLKAGKIPICASVFVADHLRPAAIATGVPLEAGQRFGLHNLRHSLTTWLISTDGTDLKTVQGILRHANPRILIETYAKLVPEVAQEAQGRFLAACGLNVGWSLTAPTPLTA